MLTSDFLLGIFLFPQSLKKVLSSWLSLTAYAKRTGFLEFQEFHLNQSSLESEEYCCHTLSKKIIFLVMISQLKFFLMN